MVRFNTHTNEILLKVVYCGPALSGKTANLQALHAICKEDCRNEFFSVNTQEDRTLFFDLLPISLGDLFGKSIRIAAYTVPGQPQYDATRRVVLDGADGVVFVADSTESKIQENIESFTNVQHNLAANGLDIKQIPLVIQYNKRDLPDAMPVGVLNRKLNFRSVPYFESEAISATGVLETFVAIVKETISAISLKHNLSEGAQNLNAMMDTIEAVLCDRMSLKPLSVVAPVLEKTTIVRQEGVSVDNLSQKNVADPQELLADALNSGMETTRLYASLKKANEVLEKQNAELQRLCDKMKNANQENLKVRKYLEKLIQSLGEGIFSVCADGRILTWNQATESIFAVKQEDAFGRSIAEFTPPELHNEIEQAMVNLRLGTVTRSTISVLLNRAGNTYPATISLFPISGSNGSVVAFSGLIKITY